MLPGSHVLTDKMRLSYFYGFMFIVSHVFDRSNLFIPFL